MYVYMYVHMDFNAFARKLTICIKKNVILLSIPLYKLFEVLIFVYILW